MIRYALRGYGSEMPGWALILAAAAEWGVPPWQVESEAPQLWWDRWLVMRSETAQARRDRESKEGAGD